MAVKETLYLVPGLLCDAAIWQPQAEALSGRYDIRIPDLTGFSSIVAMAESIIDAAPQRFSVAGHSMGARVALEIVRLSPERVERLALLDTGVHPAGPGETEKRRALTDLSATAGMRALADAWLPPMVAPANFRGDLKDILVAMVERMSPAIHRNHIAALLARPDAAPMLGAIACPVLVGAGGEDIWSPPAQNRAIADAIPGAHFVLFEGAGHMAPLETPDAVSRALVDWMLLPHGDQA